MSVSSFIKGNSKLKGIIHWMLIPSGEARPRTWVKWFVNPFIHQRGRHSKIRNRTRLDVLPFNKFQIGKNSVIEDFCTINNGVGNVSIGDHTLIGMGNVIIGPVEIGNNVILAQNVVISGLNHVYEDVTKPIHEQKVVTAKITIEDECWIAANVVIAAGVTIGKHTVIGAGAIVTKDIPSYCVAVGNPARVIKRYDFEKGEWIATSK